MDGRLQSNATLERSAEHQPNLSQALSGALAYENFPFLRSPPLQRRAALAEHKGRYVVLSELSW
jgi:hypothetical protein